MSSLVDSQCVWWSLLFVKEKKLKVIPGKLNSKVVFIGSKTRRASGASYGLALIEFCFNMWRQFAEKSLKGINIGRCVQPTELLFHQIKLKSRVNVCSINFNHLVLESRLRLMQITCYFSFGFVKNGYWKCETGFSALVEKCKKMEMWDEDLLSWKRK